MKNLKENTNLEGNQTLVTFYENTRYAGGMSHRNTTALEFSDKDLLDTADYYGINYYTAPDTEDFENGIYSDFGKELMDENEYASYVSTGEGRLDFGDALIYTIHLENVSLSQFLALPKNLKLEYVNINFPDTTEEMLDYAIENFSEEWVYEAYDWSFIKTDYENEK